MGKEWLVNDKISVFQMKLIRRQDDPQRNLDGVDV